LSNATLVEWKLSLLTSLFAPFGLIRFDLIYVNFLLNLLYGSGGEVKSLWSKYVGLHMRYKGKNSEKLK